MLTSLFPLLAAVFAALFILHLAARVLQARSRGAQALGEFAGQAAAPTPVEKLGAGVLGRLPLDVAPWQLLLRWVQLGSPTPGQSLAAVCGLSLLLGAAGLVVALVLQVPVFFIAAGLGAAFPWMQLRSQAETVQRQVKRALPEMAALIAAEMAANNPPELALQRAAELPGPLATILRTAVQTAREAGRPLFSRQGVSGVLVEQVAHWALPPLNTFARQIDLASAKGAQGATQMNRVARGLTREYQAALLARAEKLESSLLLPGMLFIFAPFMFAILATIGWPIVQTF